MGALTAFSTILGVLDSLLERFIPDANKRAEVQLELQSQLGFALTSVTSTGLDVLSRMAHRREQMPTVEWLKEEFHYGYDSGDVLAIQPDERRASEERLIGGSYRDVFYRAVLPCVRPDSRVLELGPGKGAWTRAILHYVTSGNVHTVDYQELSRFLQPEKYAGRLQIHQVSNNEFREVPDNYFDFFWSFGVLCHNDKTQIETILRNAIVKLKPGAISAHLISDWIKLDDYGWEKGGIPAAFRERPDDEIWWPRNTACEAALLAEQAGWEVICEDLNIVARDSIIILRRPA